MTPDELPFLLSTSSRRAPGRRTDCLDEHQVAAYVDATLAADVREGIEAHLADCDHCLVLVGLLSREREARTLTPALETEVARAMPLVRRRSWTGIRSTPRWAAAAVVVVAVAALIRVTEPLTPTGDPTDGSEIRTTRAAAATAPGLTLLSPTPGVDVNPGQLTVRWTAVPGTRYYDVRVVTDVGDVIAEEHVGGTEWRLSDPAVLQPGAEYFVHVDAFVADDKTVSSEHVAFRVAD